MGNVFYRIRVLKKLDEEVKRYRQTVGPVSQFGYGTWVRLDENNDSLEDVQYRLGGLLDERECHELCVVKATDQLTQIDQQNTIEEHTQTSVAVRHLVARCQYIHHRLDYCNAALPAGRCLHISTKIGGQSHLSSPTKTNCYKLVTKHGLNLQLFHTVRWVNRRMGVKVKPSDPDHTPHAPPINPGASIHPNNHGAIPPILTSSPRFLHPHANSFWTSYTHFFLQFYTCFQ